LNSNSNLTISKRIIEYYYYLRSASFPFSFHLDFSWLCICYKCHQLWWVIVYFGFVKVTAVGLFCFQGKKIESAFEFHPNVIYFIFFLFSFHYSFFNQKVFLLNLFFLKFQFLFCFFYGNYRLLFKITKMNLQLFISGT
jgi:hypothetical protein